MSFNPSIGTVSNKPYSPAQFVPPDARSMFYDSGNAIWRPYQSVAEANTFLNLAKYRHPSVTLLINSTGTLNPDGTFTGGANIEYWYKDGTADLNLIPKVVGGGGGGGSTARGVSYASVLGWDVLGDATSAMNSTYADSSIIQVVIDTLVTISGTVNGGGKTTTFVASGRLAGSGTLNNVKVQADQYQNILATTLTLTNFSTADDIIYPTWFGATTGSSNNQPAFQKCADVAIANTVATYYIPSGNWTLTKGVLFAIDRNADGQHDFFTLSIKGSKTSYGSQGSSGAETTVILNSQIDFAFCILNAKGVDISGIAFFGKNFAPGLVNNFNVGDSATLWVSAGVRGERHSPHAAIVIDGISRPYLAGDAWKYPNWIANYTDTVDNGSTDVRIHDCTFINWVVGICNSPTGIKQNAEAMHFYDCWFQSCKSGISNGQSQARSVFVYNVKMWSGIHTAFDSIFYSNNQSTGMYVDGANLAGCVKYICGTADFGIGYLNEFKNIHAESTYAIGGGTDGISTGGRIKFQNCQIDLNGENQSYSHRANVMVKCKQLVLDHTILTYYSAQDPCLMHFDCQVVMMVNGSDAGLVSSDGATNAESKIYFEPSFGTNNYSDTFYLEADNLSSANTSFLKYGLTVNKSLTSGAGQIKYGQRSTFRGRSWINTQFNVTSVFDLTGTTAVLNITPADINKIPINAPLSGNFLDDLGVLRQGPFGVVTAIDAGNFRITVSFLNRAVTGAFSGAVRVMMQNAYGLYPYAQIGDITSGSNVITNVAGEKSQLSIVNNKYLVHPAFPDGTWVVSKTATTITLSQNATYSQNNAFIMNDVNWETVGLGGQPMTTDANSYNKLAWKRGDIIYNCVSNNNSTYDPTISHWVCTQDGMMVTGGREPVFQPVYCAPDLKTRHLIGTGGLPTSNTLGTNVSSVTITGTDTSMKLVVVTSGNVSGSICNIAFAASWGSAPVASMNPFGVDATTMAAVSKTWIGATSVSAASFGGTITGAGTYTFNIEWHQ